MLARPIVIEDEARPALHRVWLIRSQKQALEETRAMFPQLRTKIQDAKEKLEQQLVRFHLLSSVFSLELT